MTDSQQEEDDSEDLPFKTEDKDDDFCVDTTDTSDEEVDSESTIKPKKRQTCGIHGCGIRMCSNLYENHKKMHKPGKYPCNFCGVIEMNALKLAVHESKNHSKRVHRSGCRRRPYKCPRCPYQNPLLALYLNHFALVHLDFDFCEGNDFCAICNIKVKSEQVHFRKHHDTTKVHPRKILNCPEKDCDAQFITTKAVTLHRTGFDNVSGLIPTSVWQRFYCNKCDFTRSFRRKETLEKHEKLHGNFKCQFCDVVKDYAPALPFHEAEHAHPETKNPAVFNCTRCKYSSKWKGRFVTHHLEEHLGVTDRLMSCTICGNKLKDNYGRALHFRTHHQKTGLDPKLVYNCADCPAYFLKPMQLKTHIRRCHRGETTEVNNKAAKKTVQYRCSFGKCRRPFRNKATLESHLKRHGSFKCKFCDVEKNFAPHIAVHEMQHANPKIRKGTRKTLFKCPRCSYRVGTIDSYVKHYLNQHLALDCCDVCGYKPFSAEALSKHKKDYHGSENVGSTKNVDVIKCNECSAHFLQKQQLWKHKWKMHGGRDYRLICGECEKLFETKSALWYHRQVVHGVEIIRLQTKQSHRHPGKNKSDHGERDEGIDDNSQASPPLRKCASDKCSKTFRLEAELERHNKLHGDFKCQFCHVHLGYAPELVMHERDHAEPDSKKETFQCARCPFSSNLETKYVRHHLKKHLGLNDLIYQCPICNEGFYAKRTMEKHIPLQHNIKNVEPDKIERCDQCSAYYPKKTSLLIHKRKMHYQELSCTCNLCGKTLKSMKCLRSHHKIIHRMDDIKFVCDLDNCEDRFQTIDELESHKTFAPQHKNVDKGDYEKVVCDVCGKVCQGKPALKLHLRVHNGVEKAPREFKCDQCDKSFKLKEHLQIHVKFHKGPDEWKYMCAVCSRKCVSKYALNVHMRTHTKEKPFVCQICGEKYAHRHNLRNHVNSKHKKEGVQDIPKKHNLRFYVSRKGKKLSKSDVAFCFTASNTHTTAAEEG